MIKGIWHTKDEIPRQESRVFWKSGNVICGGRFDTHYKCFCGPASQFVDLRTVSRWAYIDDLLALENELERTRKALDIAVDALKRIAGTNKECDIGWKMIEMKNNAHDTLNQIKTALEQKDVK